MYKKDRLTSCIFQPADGIGKKSYAAQEARPLSFMDLFVVPYTDGDRVCLSNVAENRTQNEILSRSSVFFNTVWCQSELYMLKPRVAANETQLAILCNFSFHVLQLYVFRQGRKPCLCILFWLQSVLEKSAFTLKLNI